VARPLLVNVAELLRRAGVRRDVNVSVSPAELDAHDERFAPGAEVVVDLHLESLIDGIVVDGTISTPWVGVCRRCLAPVSGRDEVSIRELFQSTVTDPDAFAIMGEQLDLTETVREHALLSLPEAALCRSDCAGWCPQCGADLNTDPCRCRDEVRDDRWSALDALKSQLASEDPRPS
jgi:uncharacterized protein